MKISQKSIRNFIVLFCIVLVLFLAGCFSKTAVTPPLPEQPTFTHYRVVTQAYKDSNPAHSIEIAWRANSVDYSFKIFKNLNGGSFEELFDDGVDQSSYYQRKSCSCSFSDIEVKSGNQYSYYVLAYDEKEEIGQTETFTRNIFLPPCTLKEPQNNAEVDTPIPTFSWDNKELTKYLTKSKAEGYLKTHLKVNNETIQEEVWNMTFEDTTVDNVTYNLDNTGEPLVNDNEYEWFHWTDAYDAEGNLIANAYSNSWHFHYKGPIKAVLMGKIMVPETPKSISKDVTGTIPLVDATITITDSEGITHIGTTQAQGQYIFPQVAPGTNYIIMAVGEVDGQTVVYKDVVPSIALHEVFDAGVADAESTALALVMEAMLVADSNLAPEDIVLDDILNSENFPALVATVGETLNSYGNVTTDPGVVDAVQIVEDEVTGDPFYFQVASQIHRNLNDELKYYVHLIWNAIPDATEYQIYKKIGNGEFNLIEFHYQYDEVSGRCDSWEPGVDPGVVSEYYIKAIIPTGDITSAPETVDIWMPSTAPVAPVIDSIVTDPTPTFQWQSLGITLPYPSPDGRVKSGKWALEVIDDDAREIVWDTEINDENAISFTYDNSTVSLVEGKRYLVFIAFIGNDGIDLSGREIANSSCYTMFYYGYKPWRNSCTAHSGPGHIHAEFYWDELSEADYYKLLKSTDGENFTNMNANYEWTEDEYNFWDEEVTEAGVPYYYKIEAYDASNNLIKTSDVLTIDAWLPAMIADNPINDEIVTGSSITFSWHDETTFSFPYGEYEFSDAEFTLYNVSNEEIFNVHWDDYSIKSRTYENLPLVEGERYEWEHAIIGQNSAGTKIVSTTSARFYYGFPLLNGASWVETNGDNPPQYYTRGGWIAYPGATSYDLYRREGDTGEFGIIYIELHFDEEDNGYNFWDDSVSSGTTYQYYMVAKDASVPLYQSNIFTIDTWLSPISVEYPENNSVLTGTELPLELQWTSPAPFPGNIVGGDINIEIHDETIGVDVWDYKTYDLSETSVTIPNDEIEFQEGHKYYWEVVYDGEDDEDEIANTVCGSCFFYGSKPLEVRVNTYTNMYENYFVEINWASVGDNYNYVIYRSEDEGSSFEPLSSNYETNDGYFPYYFVDNEVTVNNRYDYKIIAFDGMGGEISSEVVTVDTWLPECVSFTPVEGAVILENSVQIFSWTFPQNFDFIYNGKVEFDRTWFGIRDKTSGQIVWQTNDHDNWRDNITYDCSGLTPGNEYRWYYEICGIDTEWSNDVFTGLGGSFFYGSKPFEVNASSITGNSGDHQIEVRWPIYEGASEYRVYRSINGVSDGMIFDTYGKTPDFYDPAIDWWINQGVDYSFCTDGDSIGFVDFTVTDSNSYSYYVVAYGGSLQNEISSNNTMPISTWLPACWLVAPNNNSNIIDPYPLLKWSPPGISTFPYGQIYVGEMRLKVADLTTNKEVWDVDFYDWTTCSIIYNGDPLMVGHSYIWRWYPTGHDQDGRFIGEAIGGTRVFTYYEEMPLEINISAGTNSDAPDGHNVGLGWNEYEGANDYEVWRNKNNGSFEKLTNYEERNGGYWYADWDIAEDNTYDYYVVALNGETVIQTSSTITVDTWLPAILPVGPLQGSLVTEPNPVFECYHEASISFPYNEEYEYNGGGFNLNDIGTGECVWEIEADEDVFAVAYDGTPLEEGHEYQWGRWLSGGKENINIFSVCNGGGFYYGYQTFKVNFCAQSRYFDNRQNGLSWFSYQNAESFEIYKSIDGGSYEQLTIPIIYPTPDNATYHVAENVSEGHSYRYYVIAFNAIGEEIATSNIGLIDFWIPECRPLGPLGGVTITDPNPTFEWHFVDPIEFPYGDICFSQSHLWLWDNTMGERDKLIWDLSLEEPISSNYSIPYTGSTSLIDGHTYMWEYWIIGDNEEWTNSLWAGLAEEFYYSP